jgi:anti-sigma factor RsiW
VTHPTADLTALLDGALPPERADEVRRHLAECPACAAEERRLRGALSLLGALPPAPEPSPFFATRLEARLREEREGRRGLLARLLAARWKLAVPSAALAAAAVAAIVTLRHDRLRERSMAEHLALLEDYEAVASLGDVDSAEDALVVAQLDELVRGEGRP